LQHVWEIEGVHIGFGGETWGQETTWKRWGKRKYSIRFWIGWKGVEWLI